MTDLSLPPSYVCLEWQISSTFLVPRPLIKPSTCQIAKTEAKFFLDGLIKESSN
jgi:hypothetical protein